MRLLVFALCAAYLVLLQPRHLITLIGKSLIFPGDLSVFAAVSYSCCLGIQRERKPGCGDEEAFAVYASLVLSLGGKGLSLH